MVAINHRELAQECDSIPLATAQPLSRMRAESRKRRVKSGEERGRTGLNAPHPHPTPLLPHQRLPFEEEERKVFSTSAYDFFLFFFPPQSQKRLVTRASRHNGEPRCKSLLKLRERICGGLNLVDSLGRISEPKRLLMSQHVLCGFPNVNVTIKMKKNHNHNNACKQSAFMSSHHFFFSQSAAGFCWVMKPWTRDQGPL